KRREGSLRHSRWCGPNTAPAAQFEIHCSEITAAEHLWRRLIEHGLRAEPAHIAWASALHGYSTHPPPQSVATRLHDMRANGTSPELAWHVATYPDAVAIAQILCDYDLLGRLLHPHNTYADVHAALLEHLVRRCHPGLDHRAAAMSVMDYLSPACDAIHAVNKYPSHDSAVPVARTAVDHLPLLQDLNHTTWPSPPTGVVRDSPHRQKTPPMT
ncbi:hypothetical protein, partial [Rhodococcus phenolicus]|uniref:hypothetical protein n=1 Tax=Rhodococcus phenolicus TaxID=263849 RepID=UPI000A65D305